MFRASTSRDNLQISCLSRRSSRGTENRAGGTRQVNQEVLRHRPTDFAAWMGLPEVRQTAPEAAPASIAAAVAASTSASVLAV
jgi:hypothetical protein